MSRLSPKVGTPAAAAVLMGAEKPPFCRLINTSAALTEPPQQDLLTTILTKEESERRSAFLLVMTVDQCIKLRKRVHFASNIVAEYTIKSAAPVQHLIVDLQMCCPATYSKITGKSPAGKFIFLRPGPQTDNKNVGVTI